MRGITSWAVSLVLAFEFFQAAAGKLTAQPAMLRSFVLFGYPLWFMYVTAAIEVLAAVLVLIPRLAGIGAALVVCVMLGALFSLLTHDQAARIGMPLTLLAFAILLGWLRNWSRPEPRRLRPLRA